MPKTGLFAMSFMKKAMERERVDAMQDDFEENDDENQQEGKLAAGKAGKKIILSESDNKNKSSDKSGKPLFEVGDFPEDSQPKKKKAKKNSSESKTLKEANPKIEQVNVNSSVSISTSTSNPWLEPPQQKPDRNTKTKQELANNSKNSNSPSTDGNSQQKTKKTKQNEASIDMAQVISVSKMQQSRKDQPSQQPNQQPNQRHLVLFLRLERKRNIGYGVLGRFLRLFLADDEKQKFFFV